MHLVDDKLLDLLRLAQVKCQAGEQFAKCILGIRYSVFKRPCRNLHVDSVELINEWHYNESCKYPGNFY